jgi:hypothetical protein
MGNQSKLRKPIAKLRELPMLDPKLVLYDSTVAFFGPRKCGKSSILYWLLSGMNLNRLVVFCPTPELYRNYARWLPKSCLYQRFDADRIWKILKDQAQVAQKISQEVDALGTKLHLKLEENIARTNS